MDINIEYMKTEFLLAPKSCISISMVGGGGCKDSALYGIVKKGRAPFYEEFQQQLS